METGSGNRAFDFWLRTGRLPRVVGADGLELKFNPWHDPENGQFTFANTGVHYGRGGAVRRARRVSKPDGRVEEASDDIVVTATRQAVDDVGALSDGDFAAFENAARAGRWTARRENAEIHDYVRRKRAVEARARLEKAGEPDWAQQGKDFGRLYAEEAAAQAAGGAAGRYIIAPAVRAAAPAVERLVRPQAYARRIAERTPLPAPPKPTWVDENASMTDRARLYNDSAPGIRTNPATRRQQAPGLYRTTEEGKRKLVRFDGFEDDAYPVYVDRKTSIWFTRKAKDQALRQSVALRQNNAAGRWDVPDEKTKRQARKLLKSIGIENIGVKVVKE